MFCRLALALAVTVNSHRLNAFVRVLPHPTNSFTFKVDADILTLILRIFASSLSCLTALVATATLLLLALLLDMMTNRMTEKSLRKRNARKRAHAHTRLHYLNMDIIQPLLLYSNYIDLTDDKFVPKVFENACSACLKDQTATKQSVEPRNIANITFARETRH